jgi:hypothetical protein
MRTGCSSFFIGARYAWVSIRGQFVQIQQHFEAVLTLHLDF